MLKIPDQKALAALGARVSARLSASPTAYRLPVEGADIYAFADFLSPSECARLIALIDSGAAPSRIFEDSVEVAYRTSYSGDVDPTEPFVQMIERRISDLLGIDGSFGETVQGQRYEVGQEYQQHFDWFNPAAPYWSAQAETGGQRSWTTMAYLNDVEDGGATEFVSLGASITPRAGMLLVWNNACPDGSPNRATLHAARPVVRGVKYVITKWYRSRRWGHGSRA